MTEQSQTTPAMSVEQRASGVLTLRLGGESLTVCFAERPSVAMALGELAEALRIEEKKAAGWKPDLARWRGAARG